MSSSPSSLRVTAADIPIELYALSAGQCRPGSPVSGIWRLLRSLADPPSKLPRSRNFMDVVSEIETSLTRVAALVGALTYHVFQNNKLILISFASRRPGDVALQTTPRHSLTIEAIP